MPFRGTLGILLCALLVSGGAVMAAGYATPTGPGSSGSGQTASGGSGSSSAMPMQQPDDVMMMNPMVMGPSKSGWYGNSLYVLQGTTLKKLSPNLVDQATVEIPMPDGMQNLGLTYGDTPMYRVYPDWNGQPTFCALVPAPSMGGAGDPGYSSPATQVRPNPEGSAYPSSGMPMSSSSTYPQNEASSVSGSGGMSATGSGYSAGGWSGETTVGYPPASSASNPGVMPGTATQLGGEPESQYGSSSSMAGGVATGGPAGELAGQTRCEVPKTGSYPTQSAEYQGPAMRSDQYLAPTCGPLPSNAGATAASGPGETLVMPYTVAAMGNHLDMAGMDLIVNDQGVFVIHGGMVWVYDHDLNLLRSRQVFAQPARPMVMNSRQFGSPQPGPTQPGGTAGF